MGARARLTITSNATATGQFATHNWGHPTWKVGTLTSWLYVSHESGRAPSADSYESDGEMADEARISADQADLGDLDYRYDLDITEHANGGWLADLTVWQRDRRAPVLTETSWLAGPQYRLWHRVTISDRDTTALHQLAAAEMRGFLATAKTHPYISKKSLKNCEQSYAWDVSCATAATVVAAGAGNTRDLG